MKTNTIFKLDDNVEFLEKAAKNWRYGKIIDINSAVKRYKVYSGMDVFWTRPVTENNKTYLETI